MHLGRLLHVAWNKVTDKMERCYRWYGTGL